MPVEQQAAREIPERAPDAQRLPARRFQGPIGAGCLLKTAREKE
jgi:hypothetical protein